MVKTIRASSVPLLLRCPQSMRGSDRIETDNDAARLGSAVHACLADHVRGDVFGAGDRGDYLDKFSVPAALADDFRFLTRRGIAVWKELAQFFPTPEVERRLSIKLPCGTTLIGSPDIMQLATNLVRILDYKSGWRITGEFWPQLKSYILLGTEYFEQPEGEMSLVYLREPGAANEIEQMRRITAAEIRDFKLELEMALTDDDGKFTVGDHCGFCPRYYSCPARATLVKTALGDMNITAESVGALVESGRFAETWAARKMLKAAIDKFEDATKDYIASVGPIPMQVDTTLSLIPAERAEIITAPAIPVLKGILGKEAAQACINFRLGDVEDAAAAQARKGKKGKAKERIRAALEEAGALKKTTYQKLQEIKIEKGEK